MRQAGIIHIVQLLALGCSFWLSLAALPSQAQPCAADSQCQTPGITNNVCIGDTLVTRRRICAGGQCQEQETRQSCGGGGFGGTCQGNVFLRSGGGCDGLSGRCAAGAVSRDVCIQSCACQGNRLIVATGQCSPGTGCGRFVVQCKAGCTCSPQARCLEDPAPQPKGKANRKQPGNG
jgi:hypothetical protein